MEGSDGILGIPNLSHIMDSFSMADEEDFHLVCSCAAGRRKKSQVEQGSLG
jgi:hypothetical protein